MRTKITFIVDREPIELAPSGDLSDVEAIIRDDGSYVQWLLEKKFEVSVEAVP